MEIQFEKLQKVKSPENAVFTGLFGTLEGIRTPDLLVRSQTLYPTELPARMQKHYCAFAQII